MTSRGRSYTQTQESEWDPNEEYCDSPYDSQYPDEQVSGSGVGTLDHCRLYITNIPRGLNDEGLRAAFSKFGTLQEVHLSKDPKKKYGLVRFETAGEAKLAMMKMNKTEPLKLYINIAYKGKKEDKPRREWQEKPINESRDRNSNKYDNASVSSKGRTSRAAETNLTEMNGDNNVDDLLEDDYGFSDMLDPSLTLELEKLKMEQLKVREEQLQCKHRMIMLKQQERKPFHQNTLSNRCILPDGKIVVRNADRSADLDVSQSAGAGDSRVPALQHVSSTACVACGARADAYCARCGVTPYCSSRCQGRDWLERHRAVCHNLARLSAEAGVRSTVGEIPLSPQVSNNPAPLRRPHLLNENSPRSEDDSPRGGDKSFRTRGGLSGYEVRKPERNNDCSKDSTDGNNKNTQRRYPSTRIFQAKPQDSQTSPVKAKPEVTPVKVEVKEEVKVKDIPPVTAKPKEIPVAVTGAKPVTSQVNVAKQETPVKFASVGDVTPSRKVVPKNYMIELLSVGDTALLSVERLASECRSRGDYVCLTLHDKFEADYNALCEDFVVDCDADTQQYTPSPGEACSYFNTEDGGWYRGRCLNPTTLALIDSSRLVTLQSDDKIRKLCAKYEHAPEFCCVMYESKSVEIGANLKCSIISKTGDSCKVKMEDVDSGAAVGEAVLKRWVPTVDYVSAKPVIPEISRPRLMNDSRVLLVDVTNLARAFVRPADTTKQQQYDDVVQNALLAGRKASPLKEPPLKGQTVIAKFVDGIHYRALVKRTNVEKNKYLLEYIEYGNVEVCRLEDIYPCPPKLDLAVVPAQVSMVKLSEGGELTPPALEYVEKIKEEDMILTLPNGESSAESGSLVNLKLVKNSEFVNKKIIEMCTPDWKKLQEKGGDVVADVEPLMYSELEYRPFPSGSVKLEILDVSALEGGVISGFVSGDKHADYVFTHITQKMAEYCNSDLGREPYLPKIEELCIAQCPPYPQWFRAVMTEQVKGAGGDLARLCYLDYGNVDVVPVSLLRKMLPEFVRGVPVVVSHLEIKDFPKNVTEDMIMKAAAFMKLNEDGRGSLAARACTAQEPGMYVVHAPELIEAMLA